MSVVILDYGLGNLRSLSWALERIGCVHSISSDKNVIESSQKLIIPGVGSFAEAVKNLDNLDLTDFIKFYAKKSSNKIFGICLGMQLLFEGSEESPGILGLSVLEGFCKKLDAETSHVPHMGWNNLEPLKKDSNFSYLSDIKTDADFYFIHSYGLLETTAKKYLKSLRGNQYFISYIEHQNFTCAQFHPEKSHLQGLTLIKNWVNS